MAACMALLAMDMASFLDLATLKLVSRVRVFGNLANKT